ncbi:MAG: cache domain-containing protein, partial [Desulfobacula sp.]|nr:cache domain-containing protein [Desulfobacula sp.]
MIWIQGEYSAFKTESKLLRARYLESQKEMLKSEVADVVKYINDMRRLSEQKLEFVLKERVCEAHKIAMNIYRQNLDSKELPEIKKMIKDALRPVRFNGGRGYYFAVSMDGVEQLYPVSPQFEGKNLTGLQDSMGNFVIQDEIEVIKKKSEGFVKHFWIKPGKDPSVMYPKISFVKYFKPLNWYFGTGEYLDEAKEQVQGEVLNRIINLRFGKEGYFFGSTYQADSLFSNGKITAGSGNVWNLTDPNGVKIIQEQRKIVENPEGGFVYYSWNKLKTSVPSPKVSFVQGVPEWEWTIGAGVYLDTIEKTIQENKTALNIGLKKRIIRSVLILAVLFCLIYFWSKRISSQIQKSIKIFSSSLKKADINEIIINPDDIQLQEFKDIAVLTGKMLMGRKQAEDALKKSEEKYRELAGSLPQVVFEVDATGNIIYINQNAFDLFRYPKDELDKGLNVTQMIIPEDRDRAIKNMQNILNGTKSGGVEYTALRRDNTTFPVVIHSNPVTINGKPTGLRGLLIDISKQKKMETDLKRRALAIDHSSDTIVITDTNGIITYVNPAFEKITGYSRKEAVGKNPRILQSGNHDKSFYKELWESISRGKTWSGRLINKKKDGSEYTEDATISPVFSDKGKIINYVAVKRDVSEKLRLEARLQQAQKMESIGTLAGGIAHDFNNILFPILGHTEMLLEDVSFDSPLRNSLNEIYTSAMRARDLVQQILTFSRQESHELTLMKMQPVIRETLKLIRSSIPTTIDIRQDIKTDCGVIKADPTQIHQIIMNLATNAYHAMEE